MATVPSGATTGNVIVFASGVNSNGISFTVWPNISSLSVPNGPAGTSVTISGLNFGSTQGTSSVTFNGVTATTTSWGSTSVAATVPNGAKTGNVVVTVGGNPSNGANFIVGIVSSPVYHLHNATGSAPGTNLLSLDAAAPPSAFLQSPNLKGQGPGFINIYVFTTALGSVGVIPPGATVTFSFWMNETTAVSGLFPSPTLAYLTAGGIIGGICSPTSPTALTTTLTEFQFSCTVPNAVPLDSGNDFWLYVEVSWTSNIKQSVQVQVYFDGTPNGNYDSQVTIPEVLTPVIGSLSPNPGTPGTAVTIDGSSFGATQGTSTVSFGGVPASVTSWGNTQIVATAPCAAGPVVVTVGGVSSSPVIFSVPQPTILSVSPPSASIGASITIAGSNFVQTPCVTSTSFNGISSTPTSVSATQVVAPVPAGFTQGPLVVNVGSITSAPVPFAALGTINGTVTAAAGGGAVSGASVQALQSNNVVASATTVSNGSYAISNLPAGTYDVRFSASGYGTAIAPGNSVLYGASTVVNASLSPPGIISGQVTQSNGTTAIPGANVAAASGSSAAGSATTDSNGNYTISTLAPGSYTAVASATGFVTQTSGSVSVASSNTTTQNFSLPNASAQSVISYFYDELGRLIGASDSQGNTATYSYDAVGNLLSVSVNPSSQVSIVGFDPVHGAAGTSVTISGTGFSSTASQDTVTFNGTTATVTSASSTQLIVTVPAGATTGPIKVVSPSGSATSSSSFTIP